MSLQLILCMFQFLIFFAISDKCCPAHWEYFFRTDVITLEGNEDDFTQDADTTGREDSTVLDEG